MRKKMAFGLPEKLPKPVDIHNKQSPDAQNNEEARRFVEKCAV